ncbi:MAG TPA: hypothetical protein VFM23_01580 [Gemmatimonadales bacterium]|nr:hypothetical protein [Gemmatimonadales bacterium]
MTTTTYTDRERRGETRAIERFIPAWDIRTCHETIVQAPADTVFGVAEHFDLQSIPLVRAIFWLRAKLMRASATKRQPAGLAEETKRLGWGELMRRAGRELVMGAVTQPWQGDVKFTALPPNDFLGYAERDRVKIVWTIEAVPIEPALTLLRTETRVRAADQGGREKFLRYWRFARFGVVLIRWLHLPAVRRAAELQYRLGQHETDHEGIVKVVRSGATTGV